MDCRALRADTSTRGARSNQAEAIAVYRAANAPATTRRGTRLEADGTLAVLAARYGDKHCNRRNDLVCREDGTLIVIDPPDGLPRFADDRRRELDVAGVFRIVNGKTARESSELRAPNGIALPSDERWLNVGNGNPTDCGRCRPTACASATSARRARCTTWRGADRWERIST
ncbi:MAG: hypothetical protein IPG43_20890 [Proteobacteria bacterium]|nr:hypothetical protein [Pseudomonadota bacterium]